MFVGSIRKKDILNAEQLNSARLARWSQNGEARLTLEAAAEWLGEIGFCPYVPMGLTGSAPAPSFVEAVVGRPAQTPSAGERSRALELIARVIENSSAVPLKLGASLGEQPDFVCSPEVLRFVYALRGDRNFKTGPLTVGNEKVTPLALHCWQAIEQQGPLDVAALQPILGRDITEAAVARALQELWSAMYIFPILRSAGQPAQWELIYRRFPKPVAAGARTGHAEAQSAMISLYLQASVAAREEEILSFLSPLAPQSKLREVIRGLGSMRQLDILDIGGRAHVALQGGLLPEMVTQLSEVFLAAAPAADELVGEPEIAMEAEIESEAEIDMNSGSDMDSGIEIEAVPPDKPRSWRSQPLEESDMAAPSTIKKYTPKKFVDRSSGSRPGAPRTFAARSGGDDRPARRPFSGGARSRGIVISADGRPEADRPRPSGPGGFGPRVGGGRSGPGRAGTSGSGPRFSRDRDSGPSRGGFSRDRGDRGAKTQERKGYAAKGHGMGERAKRWEKAGEVPEAPAAGRTPFASKSAGFKPGGSKFRGAKPFGAKAPGSKFGSPKPWQSRSSAGEGREDRPRPWKKFSDAGDSKPDARGGARKPFAGKSGGFKPRGAKPWAAKSGDGEFSPRPRAPREAGDRPKPWQPDRGEAGDRPTGKKPYGKSSGSKPSGFTRSGFKSAGARASEARSADGESRPAGGRPWASKGASSRIGSAKSFKARSAGKTFAKAGGAKPWAKRSAASEGDASAPKRRERDEGATAGPREKSGGKPFWAKNPRGGKGSTAAGRSNRPTGKHAARKSGKKK
jgi:23S rRNA pseudouridine2605 synthase